MTWQIRACDVCKLLDHDAAPKLCSYCSLCNAWMCMADVGNWSRRARAALKRKRTSFYPPS